jgi:hypothetical protein
MAATAIATRFKPVTAVKGRFSDIAWTGQYYWAVGWL